MLLLLISSRGVSPRSRLLRSKEARMGASMSTIANILRDEDEFWLFFRVNQVLSYGGLIVPINHDRGMSIGRIYLT